MTPFTISEARKQLYKLVDDTAEQHTPIQIVGRRASAVLISQEDWEAIQETLYLNNVPGLVGRIHRAANTPADAWIAEEKFVWPEEKEPACTPFTTPRKRRKMPKN